jgi:transcription antitermination factor NusG
LHPFSACTPTKIYVSKNASSVEDGEALFLTDQNPEKISNPMSDTSANCLEVRKKGFDQSRWYAVYTWSRHEKRVARHFEERGINYFLPLYTAIHKWNKRNAEVSLPLFPGYVFVHTSRQNRYLPLAVPGVVHFVGSANSPAEIPAEEIEFLQDAIRLKRKIEPYPYLAPGNRVRITSGPMSGITGIIQRTSTGCRIIISVDMVMRSVAVEVDAASLMAA